MVINFTQEEEERVIFSRIATKYETLYEINKQTRLIK